MTALVAHPLIKPRYRWCGPLRTWRLVTARLKAPAYLDPPKRTRLDTNGQPTIFTE